MSSEKFNFYEGFFWVTLGVVALVLIRRIPARYSRLAYFSAFILVTFGISDFLQAVYGTFLVPGMEWLLVWKVLDVIGLVVSVGWYFRLRLGEGK